VPTLVAAASAASHPARHQCIVDAGVFAVVGSYATIPTTWRDLQVKHLVKDNSDEYVLWHIRGIENVVNLNASRCEEDSSKHPLDNEAPRDVVKGVPEELR
jgi:hypothetical protein